MQSQVKDGSAFSSMLPTLFFLYIIPHLPFHHLKHFTAGLIGFTYKSFFFFFSLSTPANILHFPWYHHLFNNFKVGLNGSECKNIMNHYLYFLFTVASLLLIIISLHPLSSAIIHREGVSSSPHQSKGKHVRLLLILPQSIICQFAAYFHFLCLSMYLTFSCPGLCMPPPPPITHTFPQAH